MNKWWNYIVRILGISNAQDTYVFMCANVRDARKACANCIDVDLIYEYFRQEVGKKRRIFKSRIVKVNKSGCLSRCFNGPNIVIFPDNVWYTYKSTTDIDEIIDSHIIKGIQVKRLLTKK